MNKKLLIIIIAVVAVVLITLAIVLGIVLGTPKCTVSFESNGGSEVASQTVKKGELVEEPNIPTKEEFTFIGWYKDRELTKAWDFKADKVDKDTTLYAKWLENGKSLVTFMIDGEPYGESQVVKKGELVKEPATPEKEGYDFLGWFDGEKEWNFETDKVAEAITLTAEFSAKEFEVVFKNYDDAVLSTQKVAYGKSATAPVQEIKRPNNDKFAYAFTGWDKAFDNITCNLEIKPVFYELDLSIFHFTLNNDNESYKLVEVKKEVSGDIIIPSEFNGMPVTVIGSSAFSSDDKITSVILPNTIINIEMFAFVYCTSLTKLVIPKSVEKIDSRVFTGCNNLTIYCEIEESEKPEGWNDWWNQYDYIENEDSSITEIYCETVWGYKG